MILAYEVVARPSWFGLSTATSVYACLGLAFSNLIVIGLGSSWVRSARPVAKDPIAVAQARRRFVSRAARLSAIGCGVAGAIAVPLLLPEAKSVNVVASAIGGAIVGVAIGWIMGHSWAKSVWKAVAPRDNE